METNRRKEIGDVQSEFLSYLRGMETKGEKPQSGKVMANSYPTYEAWKHADILDRMLVSLNSYPTYEAWKLI